MVPAADLRKAVAEREMDRAGELLVEEDVARRPRDAVVAADPELAGPPRAVVGGERRVQLSSGPRPRSPRRPRRRGRRAARRGCRRSGTSNEISPSSDSSTGLKKTSPPGTFTWPSSTIPARPARLTDAGRCRRRRSGAPRAPASRSRIGAHPRLLGGPVAQAGGVEERPRTRRAAARPAPRTCSHGKSQRTDGISSRRPRARSSSRCARCARSASRSRGSRPGVGARTKTDASSPPSTSRSSGGSSAASSGGAASIQSRSTGYGVAGDEPRQRPRAAVGEAAGELARERQRLGRRRDEHLPATAGRRSSSRGADRRTPGPASRPSGGIVPHR